MNLAFYIIAYNAAFKESFSVICINNAAVPELIEGNTYTAAQSPFDPEGYVLKEFPPTREETLSLYKWRFLPLSEKEEQKVEVNQLVEKTTQKRRQHPVRSATGSGHG